MSPKHICLPFESEDHYRACVEDTQKYRAFLSQQISAHAELFPKAIADGYTFHSSYDSRKQKLKMRRIKLNLTGAVFTLRPSFLMPYAVARTDEVEKALYLRQWGVPFEALAYVLGRDAMFWYRAATSFSRFNLVGTTVKSEQKMPVDLVADEKITWVAGQEVSIPTTVGGGCFLGISAVEKDDSERLKEGYGEFREEVKEVFPDYEVRSVCTDGWAATRQAWVWLFPEITLVLCFLHSVLKIAARCTGWLRNEVLERVWEVYQAETKRSFSQRLRRVREWAEAKLSGGVKEMVSKLCRKREDFAVAYDCPTAHGTSNGVDRLIDHLDRWLYAGRYGHFTVGSTRRAVRAMALQWNFHPYGARLRGNDPTRVSPFHDLNGFVYHQNWLHNLLIASSMGGLGL
jgi:hypothetical protein